jgi:hypothetical protein
MLRRSLTVVVLLLPLFCLGQSTTPASTSQESTSKQPQTTVTTPPRPEQQPETPAPEPESNKPSSGNKVTRKLGEALPDCVNLIFYHGCRSSAARQEKIEKDAQQKLSVATQRCQQLTAALPEQLAAKYNKTAPTENSTTFSSSKQQEPTPYCTPEDVVAADHDVDVGDFNFKDKNYRGAEMRYRSALERVPGEPVATLHLARALEKLGNKPEALDQYKIFLLWKPTGKDADEANTAIARLQKELALK